MSLSDSIRRRLTRLSECNGNREAQRIENALCAIDPVHWCNTWAWTYDPRAAAKGLPAYMPFDLFPKQVELIGWLDDRVAASEEGLVEKSRDVGWTWVAAVLALHKWLYLPGFKTAFGSRKEIHVDQIGNSDSIFGKIRLVLHPLPPWMHPPGFSRSDHDNYLRMVNPYNGNLISGEAGDNMGRGGRSSLYIVDEAVFVERAEAVEAAISANADCRIWASSVKGMGNLFARKRHSGHVKVFTFHWRDAPRKDEAWAAKKKAELTDPTSWASAPVSPASVAVAGEGRGWQ